jgi:hypothetical protein
MRGAARVIARRCWALPLKQSSKAVGRFEQLVGSGFIEQWQLVPVNSTFVDM